MAVKDISTLKADMAATLPTNGAGAISAAALRSFMTDLLDSVMTIQDSQAAIPMYGFRVMAGQVYYDLAGMAILQDSSNEKINTGASVSTGADKIVLQAGTTVGKWVAYFAQLNTAWGESYQLQVQVAGNSLEIYPKIGGPKIEKGYAEWDGAAWQLVAGGGSTMTISGQSANAITFAHADCGANPACLSARYAGRELHTSSTLSASSTIVNLRSSTGSTYSPVAGEKISIWRLAKEASQNGSVNPALLTDPAGKITYFGIYQE
jgi:hypothetical protein